MNEKMIKEIIQSISKLNKEIQTIQTIQQKQIIVSIIQNIAISSIGIALIISMIK